MKLKIEMILMVILIGAIQMVSGAISQPTQAQEKRTRIFDFEQDREKTLPAGLAAGMTGTWKETKWNVQQIDGNKVLAHIGFWDEDPEGVFPVCWVKDAKAIDLTLSARLFPVGPPAEIAGSENDGAGIVVRLKDPDNYYLLRSVPLEKRVRFYKVVNGTRSTLTGKNLEVAVDRWHELKLKAIGNTFTAYFNGEELFSYQDDTFKEGGGYGLWCKPNNVTYFDNLLAEIDK